MSDSDLDDEILLGLGLGGTKRPRQAGASDSEPEEDDDYGSGPSAPSRTPAPAPRGRAGGSLKKRRRKEEDEEISGDEDDEDNDGYGSDLYYDEEDRAKLASMTQLEREMVLAERAEKLIDRQERRNLLGSGSGKKAAGAAGSAAKEVDTFRGAPSRGKQTDAKRSAMDKIKAARERKAQQSRAKRQSADDDDYAISDEEEVSDVSGAGGGVEQDYGLGDVSGGGAVAARRGAAVAGGREPMMERRQVGYDDVEQEPVEELDDATWEEVKTMQVRRHKLEQWVNEPFFERCVPGSVVRLSVVAKDRATGQPQQTYLMAVVESVIERDPGKYRDVPSSKSWESPYPFGQSRTHKWLRVQRGASVRFFPMALVSNSGVSEEEYDCWARQCVRDRYPQLSRQQVEQAKDRLMEAENYVYSASDIQAMLQAKRSKGRLLGSAAAERARLERLRDAAREAGREVEAMETEQQLEQLDAKYKSAMGKEGKVAISEINRKNAAVNFRNMLHNVSNRPEGERLAEGDVDLDIYSRRKTRPQIYFAPAQKIKEGGGGQGAPSPAKAAANKAKGGGLNSSLARERIDPEHDVLEMGIDLGLLELRTQVPSIALDLLGSGWQDTLSQAAAALGAGGRPEKVLTLNDYKRRQGLL